MLSHWRRDHKPPVSANSSDSPQSSTTDKERSTTDEENAEKESIYYSSEPSTSKAQLESVSSADSGKKKDGNEPPRVSLETKLGGTLCVFYTNSPFSDFAPAPFILEGKYYPTIEHYFHIQMAYAFGLFKLAHTALQITDPGEFRKKLRTELKGMIKSGLFDEKIFSKWKDNNANKLMKNACRAKFDQNYQMRELLLHTGDRLLCFAAKNDKRLGVGMSEAEFLFWVKKNNITLEDLLNFFSGVTRRPRELGWNALGCALMDVRAEYLQKPSIIAEWKNAHPEKWKAPVDRRTIPLSAEEIGRLKNIQNDVEVCATHDIQDTTKGFDAAPTPTSSSTIRVNRSLLSLNVSTAASERSTCSGDYAIKIQAKVLAYKEERALDQLREDENEAIDDAVQTIVENMLSIVSGESHNAQGTLALEASHFSPELAPNHPDEAKESYSFASGLDDTISVKILPDEKRIVVQRKNQPKRVIGSADDKVLPPAKKSRWTTGKDAATGGSGDTQLAAPKTIDARQLLLDRMELLRGEKPMINPYAVTSAAGDGVPHAVGTNWAEAEAGRIKERQHTPQASYKPQWPPQGTPYVIERGEIPPDGVIPPPPGVEGPAYLLPLGKRDWIIRPEFPVRGRPAALPLELLPPPMCPRGVNPHQWQQRFPRPFAPGSRPHSSARMPQYPYRPPLIRAPKRDPEDLRGPAWQLPENPLAGTLNKAKNFLHEIKAKIDKRKMSRIEEGAAPTSKNVASSTDEEEKAAVEDTVAFCREIFPFGMEASLADLFDMGFVPPPIIGDPNAQQRNKALIVNDWLSQFANPEAALRHFANRWVKKGRLNTMGEYEANSDPEDDEGIDPSRHVEVSFGDDDDEKYKRSIETQVIYVDTSQYNHYVKWYQKMHGFAPLPGDCNELDMKLDMLRSWYQFYQQQRPDEGLMGEDLELTADSVGPDQLYAGNFGDLWALSRWKWAQWEQKVGRGDGAKWLDAKQETYQDEVSVTGKPMVYVHDQSQEQTDPEQEGADREITGLDREITGPDQTNKDSNQELLTHSTVDGTRNDDVNTVLIE